MRIHSPQLLAIYLGTVLLAHAQGGPPFLTDDPGTPERGSWEINTAWIHEGRTDAQTNELPLMDLNYGLGERLQLKYEMSYLVIREDGAAHRSDPSNSLTGLKWRFWDDGKSGFTASVYPQIEFRNPGSSSARRGLVADETTFILPLEIARELGDGFSLNVEMGYVRPSKSDSSWFYGAVLGREFSHRVEAGVEMHGEAEAGGARTELAVNVGVRVKLTEHSLLLASVGCELHNHFETRAKLLSYIGWQWLR